MRSTFDFSLVKQTFLLGIILLHGVFVSAQVGISIDGSSPDPAAILDIKSTTSGVLLPRMTTSQIAAIQNPVNGLIVFNADDSKIFVFLSTEGKWKELNFGTATINPDTTNPAMCGNPITDIRDGKQYNTVLIGTQCWMAQNLNTGTKISGQSNQLNNGVVEKYCYDNLDNNCDQFGGLYQWNEMMNYTTASSANPSGRQGICPAGWHIPSDAEWTQLTDFLGGTNVAGGAMKETGTLNWASPNNGATNASGFSALPAGILGTGGEVYAFNSLHTDAYFHSSTEYTPSGVIGRTLCNYCVWTSEIYGPTINGYSVRCVRD